MPRVLLSCILSCFVLLSALSGCVRVEYLGYRGDQSWPTGAAFVKRVQGYEVFEGLPQRPYEVVGLIDVYNEDPFASYQSRGRVIKLVRQKGGDAIIWLSDRIVATGAINSVDRIREPTTIDTGRSTQPEVTETKGGISTRRTATKMLRSSLLVIRWKPGVG